MITSFFPGHIRLRSPIFKDKDITERALLMLKAPSLSSILKKIEHNPLAGSVLVTYHPNKLPIAHLTPLLPFFKKLEQEVSIYSEKNKPLILSMLDELEGYIKKWENPEVPDTDKKLQF